MEEGKDAIIRALKKNLGSPKRLMRTGIIVLVLVVVLVLLSSAVYFITVDAGTYKEGDWSSPPYAAAEYTGNVQVNADGTITSTITAQDLWDTMLKNDSRVDEYLDSPEELVRLMRAQIVTQYPDTRANPDDPINWDQLVEDPNALQGIIKFKRSNEEGKRSTMTYTDAETFQGYIEEYNKTGSESAKNNALSHFTLKQSSSNTVNADTTSGLAAASCKAVVATWEEVETTVTSDDPNSEGSTKTEYEMKTTDVNYQKMVDRYTMPFDLLWALLVVGEDKDFVFELADLVYNSDMQITVYDNLSTSTEKDEWHYTKITKAEVIARITATKGDIKVADTLEEDTHDEPDPDSETSYTTTKTVVTKTNTVNAVLNKANTWIVDYQNDYTFDEPTENTATDTITKDNTNYPEEPNRQSDTYSCEHIDKLKEKLKKKIEEQEEKENKNEEPNTATENQNEGPNTTGESSTSDKLTYQEKILVEYYDKYIDIHDNITSTVTTQKYIQGTPEIREKIEPNATEPNFVTIFNKDKYRGNKSNIENVDEWLFEILETNASTAGMVDLIRYLLYKATGNSYDVLEYDFSEYDATKFIFIDGEYGDWDGTGSTADFIKAVAPYAVIDMEQHQIYASVTIAQAIIESGWGKDNIAIQYKNFFGMKAGSSSTGNEFWSGQSVALNASEGGTSYFRVYDSLKNSIYDHGRNFHVTATYSKHGVLDCIAQQLGAKEQLKRIAESGYAVDRAGNITKPDGVRTYDVYLYEEFIKKYSLDQYDDMTSEDFADRKGSEIVSIAKTKIGCPYVWGATGPDAFDCSGLVQWVFGQNGISLPRTTADYKAYFNTDKEITWKEARPGDVVWRVGHIGIYVGNDQYIHAPHTGDFVKISSGAQKAFDKVFRFSK